MKDGNLARSAGRVAQPANSGLRSVFHHFDDLASLYREISEHIGTTGIPFTLRPVPALPWRYGARDLAERRIWVFETILSYPISASITRFQSALLMQD